MPGFVDDAEMMAHLQSAIHQPTGATAGYWSALAQKANRSAYNCILGAFIKRGFTKAQIDVWPRGEEFQLDLGLWWAMVKGGAANPNDYDATLLEKLDRRKELEDETLTDDEWEPVDPVTDSDFGCGAFSTSSDIFVHPDPDDTSLGEVTEF